MAENLDQGQPLLEAIRGALAQSKSFTITLSPGDAPTELITDFMLAVQALSDSLQQQHVPVTIEVQEDTARLTIQPK